MAKRFYVPVLIEAVRYDRGTGYFSANSLVGNMRGIEGLIRNGGKMRLLVGCTLDPGEIEAVRRGEDLRNQVANNLCKISLDPPDHNTKNGLELLSWMIAKNHMVVRVAVRCDDDGKPLECASYHKKMGVVVDKTGDKIAWSGSDNETQRGQSVNSESMSVYTSWGHSEHQQATEIEFENDWSGRNDRLAVMDVPEAVRLGMLKYAPPEGRLPARLAGQGAAAKPDYDIVWSFIHQSHKIKSGDMMGLATAPIDPWPHQVQVFRRLHSVRPTRLLIADEVGLGKTIQAGLFLRQTWLEGKRRILVMAPAGLTRQWQVELREKLNLDWPTYDGKSLAWQDTHAGGKRRAKAPDDWTRSGPVIVSAQLARRDRWARQIATAEWDVVVLDEAHYARQTNPNNPKKHTPNQMLKLMRNIKGRTDSLILMTATPMQLHPVEIYDLLELLGLPKEWSWNNFERFYDKIRGLDAADMPFMKEMFQSSKAKYGAIDQSRLDSPLKSRKAISMLEGSDARPISEDYHTMKKALLMCSPVARLVSRNTRKQLREYVKANNPDWGLGVRKVDDEFVPMSDEERRIYDDTRAYVRKVWKTYKKANRAAVGFALTTYSKRLTSSLAALKATLENHLARLDGKARASTIHQDEYDDMDARDIAKGEEDILKELDRKTARRLLDKVMNMPPDTKLNRLTAVIKHLRDNGYEQIMLFTQFTDTMDFLRDVLKLDYTIMCYSGRHGERPTPDGSWETISRDDAKRAFAAKGVDVLICTDAAAEGLNFQFCGAMINYDMPWNPMRVEQRIGRIDRIGQAHESIRIVNMYYEDTVEAKVYSSLRKRINLFEDTVGSLQPILANLDRMITTEALDGAICDAERVMDEARASPGLDLDLMLTAETARYERPESPVTMKDLDRIARDADITRRYEIKPLGKGQYEMRAATGKLRITTDPDQFERHGGSMEFWSPGSPAFPQPQSTCHIPEYDTLKQLLDSME